MKKKELAHNYYKWVKSEDEPTPEETRILSLARHMFAVSRDHDCTDPAVHMELCIDYAVRACAVANKWLADRRKPAKKKGKR
jgi:hypothetical protein